MNGEQNNKEEIVNSVRKMMETIWSSQYLGYWGNRFFLFSHSFFPFVRIEIISKESGKMARDEYPFSHKSLLFLKLFSLIFIWCYLYYFLFNIFAIPLFHPTGWLHFSVCIEISFYILLCPDRYDIWWFSLSMFIRFKEMNMKRIIPQNRIAIDVTAACEIYCPVAFLLHFKCN